MVEPFAPLAHSRRLILLIWVCIAAAPISYVGLQAIEFSRNIVFWDEFDTALDFVLRIDAGASWREIGQRLFAINNEHRMLTSRLMFAASYWLTGTLNFHVLGAIGNLFLVGACAVLVGAMGTWARGIRMGVVLAFLLFQLEHFENFLWSGASIDHFQVVMLSVGAIVGISRGTRSGFVVAAILALLATFTLAHGTLTWPLGALVLVHQRRWNQLTAWVACTVIAAAAFLYGFEFNPAHDIEKPVRRADEIARYWLALCGGPLTLGAARFAPGPGLVLVAGLGILIWRGAFAREPVVVGTALFALASLALVAVGRSEIAAEAEINSRYLVLGALAWAMFIFLLLEQGTQPGRPFRLLAFLVPVLAAFNITANAKFAPIAAGFIEVRDRAATSFQQSGVDGSGVTRLHPRDGHADVLLRMAAEQGVYVLPEVCEFVKFPAARPNSTIITHQDELVASERAITIGGWAMIPDREVDRGDIHLVLRSPKSFLVLTTVPLQRPDVASAYKEPRWHWSGFRAVISPQRLPAEDFEIGVLLYDGDRAEYHMTSHRLLLSSASPRVVRSPSIP